MIIKIHKISLLAIAALCMSLMQVSCVREELRERNGSTVEGELVDVYLDLSTSPLVEMTDWQTKGTAIDSSANIEVNDIKNLWVLQFNGGSLTSSQRQEPIYLENFDSSSPVKLTAGSSHVVFVANTFDSDIEFKNCSLGEVMNKYKEVNNDESSVVYTDNESNPVKHYPMMSGAVDTVVTSGQIIHKYLYHNIARVDVIINNSAPGVEIKTVTLKSVPDRINYVLAMNNGIPIPPAPYPDTESFSTVNYTSTSWTSGKIVGTNKNRRFSFYMPGNTRGEVNYVQSDAGKAFCAPDKASYVFVTAEYSTMVSGVKTTHTVTYSFYLGANLTTDYNVDPNGHYSYTFNITAKGNELTDGRVDGNGLVDFTTEPLANSYIINPPTVGEKRNYRIPIKRVYDFWAKEQYEGRTAKDTAEFCQLLRTKGWIVDVIWSDFLIADNNFSFVLDRKNPEAGKDQIVDSTNYFEFSVKAGTSGNCVVGLRSTTSPSDNPEYLWSWHLWITDYRPDIVTKYNVANGIYEYNVPSGSVHRYDNHFFNSSSKVIMDRNIGASDVNYHNDGKGYLYYQFGRKDPFPGAREVYIRNPEGNLVKAQWNKEKSHVINTNEAPETAPANIRYSVHKPLMFIIGQGAISKVDYWTLDDRYNRDTTKYSKTTLVWQDPAIDTSTVGWQLKKSIFDPCPPGWKVPLTNTWLSFNYGSSGGYPLFPLNSEETGRYYLPGGKASTIFYPFTGYISSDDGETYCVSKDGIEARTWGCLNVISAGYKARGGRATKTIVQPENDSRATGRFVRCVQE